MTTATIVGITGQADNLFATGTKSGGIKVKTSDKGLARNIAPSTVQNKGGFLATLDNIYLNGQNGTYYHSIILN